MKLFTDFSIEKEKINTISYNSKIVLLGSCFSENIGNKLDYFKFKTIRNPFGILFHPKAIEKLITNGIKQKKYSENDLVFQNEHWHCFDSHSNLSSITKSDVLNNLNTAISITNNALKEANHLIITLGTSWVYRFIETNNIVANCHKIPQKNFIKEILTTDEITKSLKVIIDLIKSVNPSINIIFTVSPIRHLKDGFTENTLSKSHLISAIHNIISSDRINIRYFPSYEIMMDELRDYRFYKEDMIHPNTTAINYIWERFHTTFIENKTRETMNEIDTIQKGIIHRPFNIYSKQHEKFLINLSHKKNEITRKYPFIAF